jgi:large subunit ribosomal protein L4
MKLNVVDTTGKETGEIELDETVFDGKISHSLMHQAVVAYLANQRKGLACTKTRGEVSGGGKKPWRQKGTGRARAGSIRSPLWYKGGITFGPKPHSFYKDLPKRMKALALKSALNAKLKDNEIMVLTELKMNSAKTKEFYAITKNLKIDGKRAIFIIDKKDNNVGLSSRNIGTIEIDAAQNLNTYNALDCKYIVFTREALQGVENRIKKWLK